MSGHMGVENSLRGHCVRTGPGVARDTVAAWLGRPYEAKAI